MILTLPAACPDQTFQQRLLLPLLRRRIPQLRFQPIPTPRKPPLPAERSERPRRIQNSQQPPQTTVQGHNKESFDSSVTQPL